MLKRTLKTLSILSLGGAMLAISSLAGVQSDAVAQAKIPPAKVAIVDVNKVLVSSRPWQEAKGEMTSQVDAVRKQVENQRLTLKGEADELKRQQAILAPDVFQQKVNALKQKERKLLQELQVANAKLNNVLNSVRGKLRDVIVKMAAAVAREKGLNLGLDKDKVLFFKDGMDISDEVLKRFNASKTKVGSKPKG